jgi:pimeloyl-ACP methyl ester carboxylesterase
MPRRLERVLFLATSLLVATACSKGAALDSPSGPPPSATPETGRADIGGYSLAYGCEGSGSPTVLLEAGYTASGIDTFGEVILPALAKTTRVCTYDRAGDGSSDPRPESVKPLTGATQARELHALLAAIHVPGPYVIVGHSYGGMVVREFAAVYPTEVAGMVLIDASSEPEIPVYDRLHAGAWVDGTVTPATNQRIDIHATVSELEAAPSLGATPLVVLTAEVLEDRWLRTVPLLAARAQTRLAGLSEDSIHVLERGVGHFIPREDPAAVIAAVDAVVRAARHAGQLDPCDQIFRSVGAAQCLARGEVAHLQV